MTVGECFAGIGGFGLGFERAGFDIRWQIEIDPWCRAVLAKHWPHVHQHDDIRTAGAHNLDPVDVIVGGWPCQPFSSASAGRRRGARDDRWLWPEMRRLVAELRPAWVVGENVAHFDGPELDTVVADLEALHYEVAPPLEVPACAFGLDHKRARLWVLGYTDRHSQPGVSIDAEVARLPRRRDDARGMGGADVVSARLDRSRRMTALGNAIVPDIAEWIARGITEVA